MYLSDSEIRESATNRGLIEHCVPDNISSISYDLRIENIFSPDDKDKKHTSYILEPGETVFIASIENINLPHDCLGIIIQRNSCIRMGLSLASPVYQPGHHTKIFTRVTNISQNKIILRSGDSIASMMFYKLGQDVENPYDGPYVDEFDFRGVGGFHSTKIPDIIDIKEKVDSIKDIEKNMYSNVTVLMTIFIAIFSLINLNVNFLDRAFALKDILVYNFISLGGISTLVALISLVIPNNDSNKKVARYLFIASAALIALSLAVFSLL